jgi:hypothetical protein
VRHAARARRLRESDMALSSGILDAKSKQ